MAEAGLLGVDDRLELVAGEIIDMAPIGSRHAACVNRLNRLLGSRLGERVIVSVQSPVRLGDLSGPQPDVAVLSPVATSTPGPTRARPTLCWWSRWRTRRSAGTGA